MFVSSAFVLGTACCHKRKCATYVCDALDVGVSTGVTKEHWMQTWDVRNPSTPLRLLHGHTYPVRKICFSPHAESLLLSCSYDMSVRLWDIAAPQDPQVRVWSHHQEFAVGIDWDVLNQGIIASCGWDACMHMWHQDGQP